MTETNDPIDTDEKFIKFLRMTLAGNLTALRVHSTADTEHSDIAEYIAMLEESAVSYQYVAQCLALAREIGGLLNHNTLVLTALLFHRIAYAPGEKKSFRRSCEAIMKFYSPDAVSVMLISYMIAAQTEKASPDSFGDDRDYIADIVHHVYGLPWEEFYKAWKYLNEQFNKTGLSDEAYMRYTRRRLTAFWKLSQVNGIYRTEYFRNKYEEQARKNISHMIHVM